MASSVLVSLLGTWLFRGTNPFGGNVWFLLWHPAEGTLKNARVLTEQDGKAIGGFLVISRVPLGS